MVVQNKNGIKLKKLGMLIYTLAPIFSWYKISFPVSLGYALILFFSVFVIFKNKLKITVLPCSFIPLFMYVTVLWIYNHTFEIQSFFPPGGWAFFMFVLALIGGVQVFDIVLCKKYMKCVVWISIFLFFVQIGSVLFYGINQFCFVPKLTNELLYQSMTYEDIVVRHLSSSHPCSIFLEKSYMAYYLLTYLSLIMFDDSRYNIQLSKEIITIIFVLLLLRSGSGIVGLIILIIVKYSIILKNENLCKRIFMFCLSIPITISIFFIYLNTEAGQEISSRQNEVVEEGTSGYARIISGYEIYEKLDPLEKLIGKSNAKEVYGTTRSDGTIRFYLNGIQSVLIYLGCGGAFLYFLFYTNIFLSVSITSKMCIMMLLTMSLLESNYLNPYMMLLTTIPCFEYYNKKLNLP